MGDVLPAHACGEDAQWFPSYFVVFIHHEEVGGSSFGSECFLAVLNRPFQLLDCDEYLPQHGVDLGLAGIEACHRSYLFLVVKDEPAGRVFVVNCLLVFPGDRQLRRPRT